MDSVSLCNLSSECTADVVNNGHCYVNDVRIAGELGHGSIKESVVGDGIVVNNEFDEGRFSNNYPDNKMSALVNVDNNIPISEGGLKLSGDVGKVEDCAGKNDDVSFSHETRSPASVEISGNDINLFVEVFGPCDGVRNSIFKNEGEKDVGDEECTFEVGDLVWVKTETPLWWPGTICNPSNARKTKPEKKGISLVKYFGNANLIWFDNSDLKPFIEYYEELSGRDTSRSFSVAVERALSEIDLRMKSKMTCPCFSKEKNKNREKEIMPVEKKGKLEDFLSLARFEPVKVLTCIKQFATSSSYPPSKIELTLIGNRVSSFYRSIGHLELTLQTISELKYEGCSNNSNNNNISGGREKSMRAKKKRNPSDYNDLASSGKGSDPRSRKKSKSDKGSGKSSTGHHVISKEDNINASSSELLAELCLTASEHFYLERSKFSGSLSRFYRSFRVHAFLAADIAAKEGPARPASKYEKKHKNAGIGMVDKKLGNPVSNFEYVKEGLDNHPVHKKISKKKYHDIFRMISFKNKDDPISRLPDLNKNSRIPVERVPFGGPSEITFMPLQESAALNSSVAAVNTGLTSPVHRSFMAEPKNQRTGEKTELPSTIPDLNGIAPVTNSSGKNPFDGAPEGKPQQKRGNSRDEDPGGSVILKFAPGSDLPSKETLVARFSRYGLVKESEIVVINDSTVRIAYERTPDARFAFRSLEKGHSFGESLVGFDLNCAPEKKVEKKMRKNLITNVGSASKTPARPPVEKPEIAVMKQSAEMMKSTLEKMGDKISSEMRVKLENEIKAFLDKIGSMSGSSSSA